MKIYLKPITNSQKNSVFLKRTPILRKRTRLWKKSFLKSSRFSISISQIILQNSLTSPLFFEKLPLLSKQKDIPNERSHKFISPESQLSFKDPLWRRVGADILNLIGPIAGQIFQVQLGVPQDKTMDLYCQTEGMVHLFQTYSLGLLTSLQRYSLSLKKRVVHERMGNIDKIFLK